ncbi:unnamed protein product [Blepharisma stoltei]|uniref:Protein Lines N-terminal domain-containing protein n=1 Tax=Blepharisma stoltei TaxID=1481888 RepID=A0AAU9IX11_9CILI|nr:unnamed protein product [Blepharisma stoltei]
MTEELENFVKSYSPKALSKSFPTETELWVAIFQEIIEGPNFSSSIFHRVKKRMELISPVAWIQAITNVLNSFNPTTHELALLNLTHVSIAEIQDGCCFTLYHLYELRANLFMHLNSLITLPATQATKLALQFIKFIDLWCTNLHVDELDLAEVLLRIVRFTSKLGLGEEDLRVKLLCEKLSAPMVTLCKQYQCFQYASSNLLAHALPFGYVANGSDRDVPSIACLLLKDLMKSPEEGEVEESGIRDKFYFLHSKFDFNYRAPPQSVYSISKETDTPSEKVQILIQHYSEVLPNLSNSNWDTLFIRKQVLSDTYTLKIVSLIVGGGNKLALQMIDLLLSILANLIGMYNQSRQDLPNTMLLLKLLAELGWVPSLAGSISNYLHLIPNSSIKEFLLIIWNYLREHQPTNPGKSNTEPYIRSLKMLIHKNIEKLGSLYLELQHST